MKKHITDQPHSFVFNSAKLDKEFKWTLTLTIRETFSEIPTMVEFIIGANTEHIDQEIAEARKSAQVDMLETADEKVERLQKRRAKLIEDCENFSSGDAAIIETKRKGDGTTRLVFLLTSIDTVLNFYKLAFEVESYAITFKTNAGGPRVDMVTGEIVEQ